MSYQSMRLLMSVGSDGDFDVAYHIMCRLVGKESRQSAMNESDERIDDLGRDCGC